MDFLRTIPQTVWSHWGPVWSGIWIISAFAGSYAILHRDALHAKLNPRKEAWVIVPFVQGIGVLMFGAGCTFLWRAAVNAGLLDHGPYVAYGAAAACLILGLMTFSVGIVCIFLGIRAQYRLVLLHLGSHVTSTALAMVSMALMRPGRFALLQSPQQPRSRTSIHVRAALATTMIFSAMALLYVAYVFFA